MKEINIAKTLIIKRKEKGITQDELAAYIGVSKASVSKWETEQCYPDITILPQLAAYFNISIDELIGYEPQMTKEDIKKLYHRLSSAFSKQPFDEVLAECHAIIKKYYSCFPLLMQMIVLLANHHMLAKEKEEQEAILQEIIELCVRVKSESGDVWLSKQANNIEATCYLFLQQPNQVLELLDGTMKPTCDDGGLLAQAYQMSGHGQKAIEVLQISIYNDLIKMVNNSVAYLSLNIGEADRFEEVLYRIRTIAELFHLDKLHPNTMLLLYLAAAQGYAIQQKYDNALDMLKRYVDMCTSDGLKFILHGDTFFDCIEGWFAEFDLGAQAPRDEKIIKESMIQGIVSNPAFLALADQPRYKSMIETMKLKLGGN